MKTAKERLYRVDYAEEKLSDTVTKELVNTSEYEKATESFKLLNHAKQTENLTY